MKKFAFKFTLLSLFLLPISVTAGMADKFNNQQKCTSKTANYQQISGGKLRNVFYCVEGGKVTYARRPDDMDGTYELLSKMVNGYVGKMKQMSIDSLVEYAIEGNKLVHYSCKGYGSCNGPIRKYDFAVKIK